MDRPGALAQATDPAVASDNLPRSLILVVEDNPITRKLLRVSLEIGGYEVLEAGDGRAAHELVAAQCPDLLILDLVLPDTDGLDLLNELRAKLQADTPAIIVTGMVSRLKLLRSRSGGPTHFLAKPVEPSTLLQVVRAELAQRGDSQGARRILVVDDEVLNRKLTTIRLECAGYEVETVASGIEALAVARRRLPDAILSDVMMPGMDGFTLCREVRGDPRLAGMPIVLVSAAYVEDADRHLARQMGASALVLRTPDMGDVTVALAQALQDGMAPPVARSTEDVVTLHRERLQVQLERQYSNNEMLLRQSAIQATALSLIRGLAEVLAQPRDVPQVLGDVLAHCLDAAGLSTGLLYITKADGEQRLQAQFGVGVEHRQDAENFFGHPEVVDAIVRTGVPVAFSAAFHREDTDAATRDFIARLGHAYVLILPFVVLGENYGGLVLASDDHDLTDVAWIGFARSLALQFGQTVALGQSLKRLSESETRYRALVEQANDTILVLDVEGKILEANQQSETLLGVPRAEIIGRRIASFSPLGDERAGPSLAALEETITAGGGRQNGVVLRRGDGSLVEVDFALSVSEIDGQPSVVSIGRDVTQRSRDAAKLHEAQIRLAHVVASSPSVLYSLRPQGPSFVLQWTSPNVLRLLGYTPEEAMAPGWWEANVHPDDRERVFAELASLHDHGFLAHEYRYRHQDLGYRFLRAELRLLRDSEGAAGEAIGSWSDVTEKQVLQAQLVEAQKMEAVGQLAGGVAHDFNNLLGVITGCSDLLLRGLPAASRERRHAEEIGRAADRAAVLTRQLLAFSRRQVLTPRVLDLNGVVADVETMLRRLISAEIQMVTVFAEDLGRVRVDAGQVEQVLVNLVINARDAMPDGGRLVIETANVEHDEAYARSNPGTRAGRSVVVTVSDSGHGMTQETITRIFEPFFTTKEEGKGTGLGLAMVYGIVRQSGGSVAVASEPGRGTRFSVYLPQVDDAVEAHPSAGPVTAPGGAESILLVEDADALRGLVREMLEDAGYDVLDAGSPEKALELLQSATVPIQLLLTDMVMPRMNGPELARRVVSLRPETRVVLMSGYADQVVLEPGNLAPSSLFLQKPFTMDALLLVVRRALDEPPEIQKEAS